MRRFLLQLVLLGAVAISRLDGFAFALNGPIMPYQEALGAPPAHALYDIIIGPQARDEEYRWNVPIITYGYDQAFFNYFGTNGIKAIEENFKILNDLPPVSQISDQVLSNNYLFGASEINSQASSLLLIDLKSYVMPLILQHMGLSQPEWFVWSARSRTTYSVGDQQFTNYVVIQRNYDPISRLPSPVVNGITYSYSIAGDFLQPVPFVTTTAASGTIYGQTFWGESFWGLTYDDVGGLRYIYATNNFNNERVLPNLLLRSGAVSGGGSTGSPWDSPFLGLGTTVGGGVWDIPFTGSTNVGGVIVGGGGATNVVTTNLFTGVDVALRGGLDKITYVRVNFDALLGQGFLALTNTFGDQFITNGIIRTQQVGRRILTPDIMFRATDNGLDGNNRIPVISWNEIQDPINNYDINLPGSVLRADTGPNGPTYFVNGPGVMSPLNEVNLSNILPFYVHLTSGVTEGPLPGPGGSTASVGTWATFDGSTITTIYPNYMNLQISDLELLVQQSQQQQ